MPEEWDPPVFDWAVTGNDATADDLNKLGNSLRYLKRVAYVEFTADVSITATTVGTANQIVSAGALTFENVPHLIEFHCPYYAAPAQQTLVILRDSTTVLGTLTRPGSSQSGIINTPRYLTPTAASHTYNVAAWLGGAGTGTMNAGTGGTAGDGTTDMPGYIAVYRIPT